MGGLGPGIGGMEWLVIGIVALVVVGPERLPGLLRELGKWVAKARNMANEFRASFDDMARQSELDDLRKEVEALRSGNPVRLGADADAAFADIKSEFSRPLFDPLPQTASKTETIADPPMVPAPTEWPVDTGVIADTDAPAANTAKTSSSRAAKAGTAKGRASSAKTAVPKPRTPRVPRPRRPSPAHPVPRPSTCERL